MKTKMENFCTSLGKKAKATAYILIVSLLYAKTLNSVLPNPRHALSMSRNIVNNSCLVRGEH